MTCLIYTFPEKKFELFLHFRFVRTDFVQNRAPVSSLKPDSKHVSSSISRLLANASRKSPHRRDSHPKSLFLSGIIWLLGDAIRQSGTASAGDFGTVGDRLTKTVGESHRAEGNNAMQVGSATLTAASSRFQPDCRLAGDRSKRPTAAEHPDRPGHQTEHCGFPPNTCVAPDRAQISPECHRS